MNINKSNYESWFLDYFEGALSAIQVAELFLFLHEHPEYQEEFDAFNSLHLTPPDDTFYDAKEKLKRDVISKHNIDYYFVKEMENALSLRESSQLNEFIKQNPELEKTRELFSKTKLPVAMESYPDKKSLKKRVIVPLYNQFNYWAAAAAIIIMVLGIIYITRPGEENKTAESNVKKEDTVLVNLTPKLAEKSSIKSTEPDIKKAADKKSVEQKVKYVEPAERTINNSVNENIAQTNKSDKHHSVKRPGNYLRELNKDATEEALENIARAEPKRYQSTTGDVPEVSLEKRNVESATALMNPPMTRRNSFDDKVYELKTATVDKVNSITGEEILYSQIQRADETSNRLSFKNRMIKLLAWSMNKISGDRIMMKTEFDHSGNLAAYEISAGRLKVERDF